MKLRVVLVAPKFSGNVGLVVRAAANFDIEDVVVVDPQCEIRSGEARQRAVASAEVVLDSVRVLPSLKEAVSDCEIVAGLTRRTGKMRQTMPLQEFVGRMGHGASAGRRVAVVFGSEKFGLSQKDFLLCTHAVTIPTGSALASLNLSHAVVIVLARIFEVLHEEVPKEESRVPVHVAASGEMEALYDHFSEVLRDVGMIQAGNPERFVVRVRELFNRAVLLNREVALLHGFLSKVQVALGVRKRGRRLEKN